MKHRVFLADIPYQHYNYVKYALYQESGGEPLWTMNHDHAAFEKKWFTDQGMSRIVLNEDGKKIAVMEFESEGHFLMWMLRWT